jgi:hypothetical protein
VEEDGMAGVREILVRRRRAIVAAFGRTPFIQVQVESPEALARLGYVNDTGFSEADPQRLGRRSAANVAFVESQSDPDLNSSVWVAAAYSDYAGAFLAFLAKAYGIKAARADLAGYDVDHLLNRARSPNDSTMIRIEATPSVANQAWGRLFEKTASHPDFFANQHRERRTMSYMICAKLAGQTPPAGPGDQAGIARLATFFTSIGIPYSEAQRGLLSMLRFAYRS